MPEKQKLIDKGNIKEMADLVNAAEIIAGRLYFTSLCMHPESNETKKYLTIDMDLVYRPFFADFGPLNAGMLVTFCRALESQVATATKNNQTVIFYSLHDGHKRANAGFLICCYAVLCLKRTPGEAWRSLSKLYPPFLPFRDASYGVSTYNLTILDCAQGVYKAFLLGWINVSTFDLESYQHWEQIQNGDWNWMIPKRFVAMCGPSDNPKMDDMNNIIAIGASDYVPIFRENCVRRVIRLNDKEYDKRVFTRSGILHFELHFPDGSAPTDAVLKKFLDYCEATPSTEAIAVHCKAGLGRTGTLIACYLMKHYAMTAREAIAWCRLCRPGSVIGPQQHYVERVEGRLIRAGAQLRQEKNVQLPYPLPSQATERQNPKPPIASGAATPRKKGLKPSWANDSSSTTTTQWASPTRPLNRSGQGAAAAALGQSLEPLDQLLLRHYQTTQSAEQRNLSGTVYTRARSSQTAPGGPKPKGGGGGTVVGGTTSASQTFFSAAEGLGDTKRFTATNRGPSSVSQKSTTLPLADDDIASSGRRTDYGPFQTMYARPTRKGLLEVRPSSTGINFRGTVTSLPPL